MIERFKDWFNKYATLHHVRPEDGDSTNGLLFTAIYHVLYKLNYGTVDRIAIIRCLDAHKDMSGNFRNKPNTPDTHMSRDNWLGVQILSKLAGLDYHKKFFVRGFFGRMQPWDVVFNLHVSGGLGRVLAFPFMWLVYLQFADTCQDTFRKGILTTSGKQLAFGKIYGFDMRLGQKLCNRLIMGNDEFNGWKKVFEVYYSDPEHPIRRLIEEWQGGKDVLH